MTQTQTGATWMDGAGDTCMGQGFERASRPGVTRVGVKCGGGWLAWPQCTCRFIKASDPSAGACGYGAGCGVQDMGHVQDTARDGARHGDYERCSKATDGWGMS